MQNNPEKEDVKNYRCRISFPKLALSLTPKMVAASPVYLDIWMFPLFKLSHAY